MDSDDPYNRVFLSFLDSLDAVLRDLLPVLGQQESPEATTPSIFVSDSGRGRALLAQLKSCLEKNDPEAAAILPEFGSMRMAPELDREWSRLQSHIANFDFDEALDVLKHIETWLHEQEML
jgi:hypothetical protein